MIIIYDQAQIRNVTADYAAYRDRVVAAGGSIASASATQAALNLLLSLPNVVQWLDTRHGLGQDWYSICGSQADAQRSIYGSPTAGSDATLSGSRTLSGGAWNGGSTPELVLTDDYTWYMRGYITSGADGFLWGDRYNSLPGGQASGWNYLAPALWRSYNKGVDASTAPGLPTDQWFDFFEVKSQATVTSYLWLNGQETTTFSLPLSQPIAALSLGIAGGTDATGICPAGVRYQTFARFAAALTAPQRAALVAL